MSSIENIMLVVCMVLAFLGLLPFFVLCAYSILIATGIYAYCNPPFETALIGRYWRPIAGLKLCPRCKEIRYSLKSTVIWHYDDPTTLRASADSGCWLCGTICRQMERAIQDRDQPPVLFNKTDLEVPHLLMWFARSTKTRTGYLNHLRHITYGEYVYGKHVRKLYNDLSSDHSFNIVKEWVDACNGAHKCYQGSAASLPARVIDVSQDEPRLLESNGLKAPYMTLSHCWGDHQPLTTTLDTLSERVAGIPMESLPPLYRDAVGIARKLDVDYLWIDSLCIIQGCKEDWSKEAAKMGDVYRCSYLTLYALDSRDCRDGILLKRSKPTAAQSNCGTNLQPQDSTYYSPPKMSRKDIFKGSALCQRAWALQERLLSPRVLYYGATETLWGCLEFRARESTTKITLYRPTAYAHQDYECPTSKIRLIRPIGPDLDSFPPPPSDWYIMVTEYSRCRLTQPPDKLPAISGLASVFQSKTGYTYLAGLWKEDFADGLLWFVPVESGQTLNALAIEYRGPSWSWVSTDLPVQYKTLTIWYESPAPSTNDIELVGSDVQYLESNAMGKITHAAVTAKAFVSDLRYECENGTRRCTIYDETGVGCGKAILDAEDDDPGVRRECAGVWVTERRSQIIDRHLAGPVTYKIYFLVVVPASGDEKGSSRWRRIGLAWATRLGALYAAEKSYIELV